MKAIFRYGKPRFAFAILFAAIATLFISAQSAFAEATYYRGLFTGEDGVRWEYERYYDEENTLNPEAISIMFYDKPEDATRVTVPSLSEVISKVPDASSELTTYFVKNADLAYQAANYTEPEQAKRTPNVDTTVLDMTDTSMVQILGVDPIINPDVMTELIFGDNMVIGDHADISLSYTLQICTDIVMYDATRVYSCRSYGETRTFDDRQQYIADWDNEYVQYRLNYVNFDSALVPECRPFQYRAEYDENACYYNPSTSTMKIETAVEDSIFGFKKLKLTNLEKVKYIGFAAFYGSTFSEDSRAITLGENQTAGWLVFAHTNVNSVKNNGTIIYGGMFKDCPDLTGDTIDFGNTEIIHLEAFENTNLGSVDFSNSKVKRLHYKAFKNAHLTSINIEGIERLDYEAFAENDLTELYMPRSLSHICERAIFDKNYNLTKLTIAYDTLKAENSCPLHTVMGQGWDVNNGYVPVIYSITELELIAPYGPNDEVDEGHVKMPGEQISGDTWFEALGRAEDYKNVVAPNHFYGFKNVAKLTIGEGYEFIGARAFYCYPAFHGANGAYYLSNLVDYNGNLRNEYTALSEVSLPSTLKGIGFYALGHHSNPNFTINLPESLEYIGTFAFYYNVGMKNDIDLPNLKYIGSHAFFVTGVHDIYLHDSIIAVGHSPFQSCFNIHDVTFDYDVFGIGGMLQEENLASAMLGSIMGVSFSFYNEAPSYVGEVIPEAGWGNGVRKLGTITFTEKATTERSYFIFNGVAAEKIDLSKTGWKKIPDRAFIACAVGEILLPETLEEIGAAAFQLTRIESELILPETLKKIGVEAFSDWNSIKNDVYYHDSDGMFYSDENPDDKFSSFHTEYLYYFNLSPYSYGESRQFSRTFDNNGRQLDKVPRYNTGVKITKLPASLETIGYAAFYGDQNFTADVNLPNIQSVGHVAFQSTRARDIYVTENMNIDTISGAFTGIPTIRNIIIDYDVFAKPSTNKYSFQDMVSSQIFDENAYPKIYLNGYGTSADYYSMVYGPIPNEISGNIIFTSKVVATPDTTTRSGYFEGYDYFTDPYIGEDGNWYGSSLSERMVFDEQMEFSYLTSFFYSLVTDVIDLSDAPWTTLPANMFNNVKAKKIILPRTLTTISDYAFYNTEVEEPIEIPASVTTIGHEAFHSSKLGFSNGLPEGVTTIEDAAFYSADIYGDLTIPSTVTSIGLSAFNAGDTDTHYDTVSIKAPLDYAKTDGQAVFQMFWGATMDKLVIESSMLPVLGTLQDEPIMPTHDLRWDGEPEFHAMTMKEVEIKNLPVITANAFEECAYLEKVSFSSHDSLTSIERYAFNNDTKLKTFVFGDGLVGKDVKLGTYAFNNTAIETIGDHNTDFDLTAANFDASETLVFANLPALKSVYIPSTFTVQSDIANAELFTNGSTVPAYTFAYDPELEEVTLGYQVSRVDDGAFVDDNKLAKLFVWGNTEIQESNEFIAASGKLTIPEGTTIFAYSDAPAEGYANAESRDNYTGKFYALDEVLALATNKKYVILTDDKEDFDKTDLKLYALRRDGVVLESDNWQEYTTAYSRKTTNINFEEGRGALGDDNADIAAVVYDAPKPFDAISLTNENYVNVNFAFTAIPSNTNPLVLINYPDGYTGNIRTVSLISMTKEEEEEYLRRLEEELEVPDTGVLLSIIKTATPVISIAAIALAGGLVIVRKRR